MLLYFPWESFVRKLITSSLLLWTLVSCSNAAQPIPISTAANDSSTTTTPEETQQVPPSLVSTLETLSSAVPDSGGVLNPQGNPAQEWRGIPIMPEATAGQEITADNAYSFRTNVTAQEVQEFYGEHLGQLGWSQPFESSFDENGGTMTFRKEGSSLAITVTLAEGSVVVLLVLTMA
jgi:hypothetical protein